MFLFVYICESIDDFDVDILQSWDVSGCWVVEGVVVRWCPYMSVSVDVDVRGWIVVTSEVLSDLVICSSAQSVSLSALLVSLHH